MGTESRQDFTSLIKELEQNAPGYNVFQAIFMAEQASKKLVPTRDEEKFDQKGLRFRPYEMYVYPPTDVREFSFEKEEITFVLNFMGLYGINSPLPRCYHEQVSIQQSVHGAGEVPVQNFLDIFNNRFYWLYYHAWKKYRHYLQLSEDMDNKHTQRIFSFIGLGPRIKRADTSFSPYHLMQLSGILNHRIRNKMGLQILLEEYIPGCKIKIKEFVPSTVELSEIPRVGKNEIVLGQNSILGKHITDYMSKICIQIGPVPFEKYLDYIPGEGKAQLLKELVELYLNDNIAYDVEFLVCTDEIATFSWKDTRLKLGQSIWLGKPKQEYVSVYYNYQKMLTVA